MFRAFARLSVSNSVAVHLATLLVVVSGLAAYFGMPREVFPEFSLGTVTVTTFFPGAAPEDVERLVTLPIEERLEGLDGLDDETSLSQEGVSTITLKLQRGVDEGRFLDDVRAAVQSGDLELPPDVDDPVVREVKSEFPVIGFYVYGHADEAELRRIAEEQRRELEQIDGVARVLVQGAREPRIWVEVDPRALERHSLSLGAVRAAIAARANDVPSGSLQTASGDYLLRVDADVVRAEDLRSLPLIARTDGTVVRLAEVGRIHDTYERRSVRARFNGQPSISLRVNKGSTGDAIAISRAVYAHVERARPHLPPGIELGTNSDLSVYIENRLRVMRDSAILGGVLVLISLVLFLNLRVAALTALGIPVSFLGGILIAALFGISMNMMTMFALIVVLGMIVDDAIVVGENVFRLMEEGLSPAEAAIQGTAEVGKPVTATILTTIAAFLPALLIGGTMGNFMRPLPLIVTFCLLASLAEALFVLPSHLAHFGRAGAANRIPDSRPEPRTRWYDPLRRGYVRLLERALRRRYVTIVLATTIGLLALGYGMNRLPFVLFDDFESKVFSIDLRATPETSVEDTDRIAAAVEERVRELPASEVESTNVVAGVSYQDASRFEIGQNLGQVWVELRETEGRRSTAEIFDELRAKLDPPPVGIESVEINQPQAGPTGKAIDIAVRGPELEVLELISGEIQERLRSFRGVRDVHDNSRGGKREVRVRLTERGRLLGFTEASLGRELRSAFEGVRAASVRRGRDEVEVTVKLPEEMRLERGVLASLPVGREGALPVPLASIAELLERESPAVITRDGGERSLRIVADVNKQEGNAAAIVAALEDGFADLDARYPGYSMEFKGEQEDATESFAGLRTSLLFALFLIYLILGSLFRSFGQPLVIMSAIPFAGVGMVLGHALMDRPLSFMSLIGFVALTGIVVNDSLILLDFVNRRRQDAPLIEALVAAGHQRFRPILLTSVTTMLGLTPLTFFASGQARFLQPMAITIFFGLGVSTFLVLVVVPCFYAAFYDGLAVLRSPRTTLAGLLRGREPSAGSRVEETLA